MKRFRIPVLIGALLWCQVAGLHALSVRALALGGEESIPRRFVKAGEGYVPLTFSSLQPSAPVEALAGETLLPLFEIKTDEAGRISYALAEKITLSTKAKGVLLLGWGSPKGTRYLAIDDNYLTAKYNDWLLINATPKLVALQMGHEEKPVALSPNAVVQHRINMKKDSGLAIVAQAKWEDKVKTFYSTYWPLWEGERGIVIFFERGERIAVRKITDVLLKPEVVKEAAAPPASQSVHASR